MDEIKRLHKIFILCIKIQKLVSKSDFKDSLNLKIDPLKDYVNKLYSNEIERALTEDL